jgi:hypothetical protein
LKSGLVRLTIRQPLACRAFDGKDCTFPIVVTEFDPVIVTEIKLCEVAVKMRLRAMLIDALHAALED